MSRARSLLSVLVALAGVVALFWIAREASETTATIFAARSSWALALVLAAGGATLAVGLTASLIRRHDVVGPLVTGLGLTWLAWEVAGLAAAPAWARSLAPPAGALFMPLLVHLALVYPNPPTAFDRRLIRLAYGIGFVLALLVLLGHDPFLDLKCRRSCSPNLFALFATPQLTGLLPTAVAWANLAVGATLVWRRSIVGTPAGVPHRLVTFAVIGLAIVVGIQSLFFIAGSGQSDPTNLILFSLVAGLVLVLATGLAWDLADAANRRRSLAALASDLEAGTSGSLATLLRRSLGDDTVEVGYWIPRLGRHVDADGIGVDTNMSPGRSVALIERSGEELGRVLHGSTLSHTELEDQIGSAARLAVDNERLRAELRAQAMEMRESQERIVLAADTARRRLERDLHDGAQQRLITLSYQLRLAQAEADLAEDPASSIALRQAIDELVAIIDDVRDVAHGIFPSILADAGLGRALESLTEGSDLSLHVEAPPSRMDPSVEMAAYHLVVATVDAVESSASSLASVVAAIDEHRLGIEIEVTGDRPRPESLIHAIDRVGAIGGEVTYTDTGIRASIPCG
jgi:signal transduction histidine kinase